VSGTAVFARATALALHRKIRSESAENSFFGPLLEGCSSQMYSFFGLISNQKKKLKKRSFKLIQQCDEAIVLYESKHRLVKTLEVSKWPSPCLEQAFRLQRKLEALGSKNTHVGGEGGQRV